MFIPAKTWSCKTLSSIICPTLWSRLANAASCQAMPKFWGVQISQRPSFKYLTGVTIGWMQPRLLAASQTVEVNLHHTFRFPSIQLVFSAKPRCEFQNPTFLNLMFTLTYRRAGRSRLLTGSGRLAQACFWKPAYFCTCIQICCTEHPVTPKSKPLSTRSFA